MAQYEADRPTVLKGQPTESSFWDPGHNERSSGFGNIENYFGVLKESWGLYTKKKIVRQSPTIFFNTANPNPN